jgi:anaerobic selenocysteine-containing dehydrogenase
LATPPQAQGLSTSTGKLELASEYLDALGGGRLPVPVPMPSDPAYPFTMITGARMQPYWASSYFNNPRFRAMHPDPTAQMSRATLAAAGLEEGQWVEVGTARGCARFKAEVADIVDGVVSVEYGWWYPEEEQGEPHLSGLWRSNVNVLTNADIEGCELLIGTWTYNAIPCSLVPL